MTRRSSPLPGAGGDPAACCRSCCCKAHIRAYAPVRGEQFGVGAALGDAAMLEHQNLVSADDRRQAVGDRQRRAVGGDLLELGLDQLLGFGIERRGRLVEDQDPRVLEDRARNRDPLLLAAG